MHAVLQGGGEWCLRWKNAIKKTKRKVKLLILEPAGLHDFRDERPMVVHGKLKEKSEKPFQNHDLQKVCKNTLAFAMIVGIPCENKQLFTSL